MRIVGQGQAAVPWERGDRRRVLSLPGEGVLGRRRRSCVLSQYVERYPEAFFSTGVDTACFGEVSGFAMGASAFMVFFCANRGDAP